MDAFDSTLLGQFGILGVLFYVLKYVVAPMITEISSISRANQRMSDKIEELSRVTNRLRDAFSDAGIDTDGDKT